MNEILDHTETKNQKRTFSKLSLIISLITLGLFGWLFSMMPTTIKASDSLSMPAPPMSLMIAILVFSLLGMIMTIGSFAKKEPHSWYKWLGGILNILFFLFLAVSAIITAITM